MRRFEADRIVRWFRADVLERASRDIADPKRSHELQARQSSELRGMPFAQGRVIGALAGDDVLLDSIAEVVDHCSDGEHATESFVERLFGHGPALLVRHAAL